MLHERRFALDHRVTFELGDDFWIREETNSEGKQILVLVAKPEINDDGETEYCYKANISYFEVENGGKKGTAWLDDWQNDNPEGLTYRISGENTWQFATRKTPLNIGGKIIKMMALGIQFPVVPDWILTVGAAVMVSDDPHDNLMHYQEIIDAARTIRINGKPLDLSNVTAATLLRKITPEFAENEEGVANINMRLGVKLKLGDGDAKEIGSIVYRPDGSTDFERVENPWDEDDEVEDDEDVGDDDDWDDSDDEDEENGESLLGLLKSIRKLEALLEDSGDEDDDVEDEDDWDDDEEEDDEENGDDLQSILKRISRVNDQMEEMMGITFDDEDEDETEWEYPIARPEKYLYSHYGRLKSEYDSLSSLGGHVVINGQGTDFDPRDLMKILKNNDEQCSASYKAINAAVKQDAYSLDQSALRIAQVFRVNRVVFNDRHDRECAIREGMYEKKYMLSALRSFAWTIAQKAEEDGRNITDYDFEELNRIADFVKERELLNYKAGSWFNGLCGHSDIHVIYAPQQVFDQGLESELGSKLDNLPVYSLDALREDLAALEDVMITVHNGFLGKRDRNKALDGTLADILNAWAALCVAARKPFFSEDGPRICFYRYPNDPLNTQPIQGRGGAVKLQKTGKMEAETVSAVSVNKMTVAKGDDGRERFTMGEFPQTGWKDPIEWIVLKKESGKVLALSRYVLYADSFGSAAKWETSNVRQWLNSDFYKKAFSSEEKAAIITSRIKNSTMQEDRSEEADPDTMDKVFLLNSTEALTLLPTEQERVAKATKYAKRQGVEISNGPDQCFWWLRGPSFMMWAPRIKANGSGERWGVFSGDVGVRPAIWVDSSKLKGINDTTNVALQNTPGNNKPVEVGACVTTAAAVSEKGRRYSRDDSYMEKNPDIQFRTKEFVFTGIDGYVDGDNYLQRLLKDGAKAVTAIRHENENLPIIRQVTERGGEYSSTLTELTDYLIVGDLKKADQRKITRALEEKKRGTGITIISVEDLEKALKATPVFCIPKSAGESNDFATVCYDRNALNTGENKSILKAVIPLDGVVKQDGWTFRISQGELLEAEAAIDADNNLILPEGITCINEKAFQSVRRRIVSIVLPQGLEEIHPSSFKDCSMLESVKIHPGITKIQRATFWGCRFLKEISIPESVTTIGDCAFMYCSSLTKVVIPEGVTDIEGTSAFSYCPRLESVVLPKSLKSIDDTAFWGSLFVRIQAPEGCFAGEYATKYNMEHTDRWLEDPVKAAELKRRAGNFCSSVQNRYTLIRKKGAVAPLNGTVHYEGWTLEIDKGILRKAYPGVDANPYLMLPEGIRSLADGVFRGCKVLQGIALPHGTEIIQKQAVSYCRNLDVVVLPETLAEIGPAVFEKCINLRSVVMADDLKIIGQEMFAACSSLKEITLPNNLKSIGEKAFYGCERLKKVNHAGQITEIGEYAFGRCYSMEEMVLPEGITHVNKGVFYNCSSLRSMVIPDGVTSLGESVFSECFSLTNMRLPRYLEEIGDGAFFLCIALESIYLPDTLVSIGSDVFNQCTTLCRVTLPGRLMSIKERTFSYCRYLTEIGIPESTKCIEKKAFIACSSLKRIVIPGSVTEIGENVFGKCDQVTVITSPGSCAEKYATENKIPVETTLSATRPVKPTVPKLEVVVKPTAEAKPVSENEPAPLTRRQMKIKRMEKELRGLQKEYDQAQGVFGFVKRTKLKGEIAELTKELEHLKAKEAGR